MLFSTLSFATLIISPTIFASPLEFQRVKRANAGQFGTCSDPTIAFGDFDGRKVSKVVFCILPLSETVRGQETSFNPGNPKDYNVRILFSDVSY